MREKEVFYIATLHSSKRNKELVDKNGQLRANLRRNLDYIILDGISWNECKEEYDIELPVANNIYQVLITFSCQGISFKTLYVHGIEKVFDVIQTLFVNKAFGLEAFLNMFEVKMGTVECVEKNISQVTTLTGNRMVDPKKESLNEIKKNKPDNSFEEERNASNSKSDYLIDNKKDTFDEFLNKQLDHLNSDLRKEHKDRSFVSNSLDNLTTNNTVTAEASSDLKVNLEKIGLFGKTDNTKENRNDTAHNSGMNNKDIDSLGSIDNRFYLNKSIHFSDKSNIYSNAVVIDPDQSFNQLASSENKIILFVERKKPKVYDMYSDNTILESNTAYEIKNTEKAEMYKDHVMSSMSKNISLPNINEIDKVQSILTEANKNESEESRISQLRSNQSSQISKQERSISSSQIYSEEHLQPLDLQKPSVLENITANQKDYSNIAGLINLGNTCYINTSLQCLYSCSSFITKFLSNSNVNVKGGSTATSMAKFLNEMKTKVLISPADIKRTIAMKNSTFDNSDEQDAEEFISTVLDNLHEELKEENKRNKDNLEKQKHVNSEDLSFIADQQDDLSDHVNLNYKKDVGGVKEDKEINTSDNKSGTTSFESESSPSLQIKDVKSDFSLYESDANSSNSDLFSIDRNDSIQLAYDNISISSTSSEISNNHSDNNGDSNIINSNSNNNGNSNISNYNSNINNSQSSNKMSSSLMDIDNGNSLLSHDRMYYSIACDNRLRNSNYKRDSQGGNFAASCPDIDKCLNDSKDLKISIKSTVVRKHRIDKDTVKEPGKVDLSKTVKKKITKEGNKSSKTIKRQIFDCRNDSVKIERNYPLTSNEYAYEIDVNDAPSEINLSVNANKEYKDKCKERGGDKNKNEKTHEDEFLLLLNNKRSLISDLFYGMVSHTLTCSSCKYKKTKNEIINNLSLSIPNKIVYHCSSFLVRSNDGIFTKILIPLSFTIQEAKDYISTENSLNYPRACNIIAFKYDKNVPLNQLHNDISVNSVYNTIVFFEVENDKNLSCRSPDHVFVKFFYKKLIFFTKKFPLDLVISLKNNYKKEVDQGKKFTSDAQYFDEKFTEMQKSVVYEVYRRLKPFLSDTIDIYQFAKCFYVKEKAYSDSLEMNTIDFVFNDTKLLFGSSLSEFDCIKPFKKNDITITDCLNDYFKEEEVDLKCENCNKDTKYVKESAITRFPTYLIVQFKRFRYSGTGTKINTFIDFPLEKLKMKDSFGKDVCFRLMSSANHIEIGLGYGHYMAYVRRERDWYCCNDSVITKTVGVDKSSSYILFYEIIK